jgi:hypothetical protein
MADVKITWKKIKELPSQVNSWRDIVYYIRLSPPFMIHYSGPSKPSKDDDFVSPLVYVGSGNARGRLGNHLGWLKDFGQTLPHARYEVWIAQPKVRNNANAYLAFEGYILREFERVSRGWLPLRNKKTEAVNSNHNYETGIFDELIAYDNRYTWAIWPYRGKWNTMYCQGGKLSR